MVATQEEPAVTAAPFRMDFASFYQRELRPVIGLAFVLSGIRSGAEDLAQDAFLKAYKQWETVGAYDNPGAWVHRVVSNNSVSAFRRGHAEAKALVRFAGSRYVVPGMSPDAMTTWAAVRLTSCSSLIRMRSLVQIQVGPRYENPCTARVLGHSAASAVSRSWSFRLVT